MRTDYVEKGWQRWVFVYIPIIIYVTCFVLFIIMSANDNYSKPLIIFLLCFMIVDITAFALFSIIKYFRCGRNINGLLALIALLCCLVIFAMFICLIFQTSYKIVYQDLLEQQLDNVEYGSVEYEQLHDEFLKAIHDTHVSNTYMTIVGWLFILCACLIFAGLHRTKPFEEWLF